MFPILNQSGWVNVDVRGNVIGQTIGSGGPVIDIIGADRDIRPNNGTGKKIKRAVIDEAKEQGNKALDAGKKALKDGAIAVLASNPATAPLAIGASVMGGGESWIEQLQNWIKESGIFQRLALAIMAFVFIAVALSMFGRQSLAGNLASVIKGK